MKYLWAAGAVVSAVGWVWLLLVVRRRRPRLKPVLVSAVGAFLLVTGWLLVLDPNSPKHELIKSGGLAAGSVVALYALWLNDRRRRMDEKRHDLEIQRAEHDRSRVADERFARSVELLGHETEQVRVGAMHALAGLARSRPEYTQTVLDVLCAYLRRPFQPDALDARAGERAPEREPDGAGHYTPESERELEVRLTAQRLVADLLPRDDQGGAELYDLNLTRAYLEYFDLSHRQVGELTVRAARLARSNSFHHLVVHGGAWFTDSVSTGRLHMHDMMFCDLGWFSRVEFGDRADFARTRFFGRAKFAGARFRGPVTFEGARFDEPVDRIGLELPPDAVPPAGRLDEVVG
ncbi:pentapeptide repeat-containing protein [Saccharothrix sp. NPDC042600]|uniref:pentapeptide repeat-containing protein n=1 Tax=Saccharothrix TaxID=2071 RepID=UPI00340C4CBF|nr:pentapeptide repeat-containing protein [Saccharothrix mutabilis subsp. capreolus]